MESLEDADADAYSAEEFENRSRELRILTTSIQEQQKKATGLSYCYGGSLTVS